MSTLYHVVHKSEHGGFWNGQKAVREIDVENEAKAKRLEQEGHSVTAVSSGPDFSAMKVDELRSYAAEHGIDVSGLKTKAQLKARIESAE